MKTFLLNFKWTLLLVTLLVLTFGIFIVGDRFTRSSEPQNFCSTLEEVTETEYCYYYSRFGYIGFFFTVGMLPYVIRVILVSTAIEAFLYLKKKGLHYNKTIPKTKLDIDKYGRNDLINNVIDNHVDEVVRLIKSGADINFQDKKGWTPLHFASQSFNQKMIVHLLNNGADPNKKNIHGNTPFFTALFNCKGVETNIFEQFKIKSGNPQIRNNDGVSPLDLAKKVSNYDLKKYFPEYFNKS